MWKFRSPWFCPTTRDCKNTNQLHVYVHVAVSREHAYHVYNSTSTDIAAEHSRSVHIHSNKVCVLRYLACKQLQKPLDLTFSSRKFEILPPSGSPPRLNWISTYLPCTKYRKTPLCQIFFVMRPASKTTGWVKYQNKTYKSTGVVVSDGLRVSKRLQQWIWF